MNFNLMGFALASALTQNMPDRQQAAGIDLVGGLMGSNPLGLVLVATLAQQNQSADSTGIAPTGQPAPELVVVPNVSRKSFDEVTSMLTDIGLVAVRTSVLCDKPIGDVLETVPAAGSLAQPGSSVQVAVSIGKPVSDVTQLNTREAADRLKADGFRVQSHTTDQTGAPDTVLRQEPQGGEYLSAGESVSIFHTPAATAVRAARGGHSTASKPAS
jgi:hypothetical protein